MFVYIYIYLFIFQYIYISIYIYIYGLSPRFSITRYLDPLWAPKKTVSSGLAIGPSTRCTEKPSGGTKQSSSRVPKAEANPKKPRIGMTIPGTETRTLFCCMDLYVYISVCIYIYTRMYVRMYIYICIYIYIYIYTYTHNCFSYLGGIWALRLTFWSPRSLVDRAGTAGPPHALGHQIATHNVSYIYICVCLYIYIYIYNYICTYVRRPQGI